jgi:hypothetical protein
MESDRNTILKMTPMIITIDDNPKTFHQAMSSKNVVFFKKAVNNEMYSILSNNT